MSTHARPLATRLAGASDARLERLLRWRGVREDATWTDFFDAAESLLEASSIDRALAALTRDEAVALQALAHGGSQEDIPVALIDLALVDDDGHVPGPVADAVTARPSVAATRRRDTETSSAEDAARAAERAFTTVGVLADVLLTARQHPLALVATGALAAGEKRRLAEAGLDIAVVDDIRILAETTGLAGRVDRELRVTRLAEHWLDLPFAPRWARLAEAFREALPRGVRDGTGWIDVDDWDDAHPWDPAWPDRARQLQRLARLLGLRTDHGGEPAWSTAVRRGGAADTSDLTPLLPSEVDRLFLQNDLTAIAPGPLLPVLDNRLRAMTEQESTAQASSYRFTADSLARALVEGETAESILDFLREVSLTGVPQPLEYLVAQSAARHGLIRVAADDAGGSVVSADDPHLLEAMEVDHNLRPIRLVRDAGRLLSRVNPESVAWALSDARYPATLVDADGRPTPAPRRTAERKDEPATSYAPLIARLRAHESADADAAWLDRELDAAVRSRAHVAVEVAMPDGSSRELLLEATSLGGGRLRGRDRSADVERTLPVRSIRSVRILES